MKKIIDILSQLKIGYMTDEPLSNHTSVKVGGNAKYFAMPNTRKQLIELIKELKSNETKYYILGNGTNTLASDSGFDGVVVSTKNLKRYKVSKNCIFVQCGLGLFEFAKLLKKYELAGLEFAYGIPGSVGGAIFMNAGAYGGFVGNFVDYILVLDNGKQKKIYKKDLNFSYRESLLQNSNLVVLGAKFVLEKGSYKEIEKLQNEYFERRLFYQPYDMPSFGSCFKRNENFLPISKLIDDLGLKGFTIGGAQISKKHAGFIVNVGGATCQNYEQMIKYIQSQISEHYGFVPELEVRLLK